jgi:hypothetical protein
MMKKYLLFLLGIAILAIPCLAWDITIDRTSPSSIVWNVSQKPGEIAFASYDGINLSGYDPNTSVLIQSDLSSGTYHSLKVISSGETATLSGSTNTSAAERVNTLISDWFYVGLTLVLFFCGFAIHRWLFFVGSGISLYGLAVWMEKTAIQVTDIWHIQYFIYIFFFVFGFFLWAVKIKTGGKNR